MVLYARKRGNVNRRGEYSKSFGLEEGERGILPVMSGVGVLPPPTCVVCIVLLLHVLGAPTCTHTLTP